MCTVTYTDGVENEEIFAGKVCVVEQDSATPAFDGNPTRSGYTFMGWSPAVTETVTADVTYTAQWKRIYRPTPSTPTVEIPDDDALGLNTDDHFAYIIGYPDGTVQPNGQITRAEATTIFFRLLTEESRSANLTKTNGYTDVAFDAWYNTAVSTMAKAGIVDGYPDGTFGPQRDITRAETMTLVNRVLNRQPETEDDLLPNMTVWTDNANPKAWYYLAVQEATNSHYYKFKTNSKYEKWTELRETRDWSQLEK